MNYKQILDDLEKKLQLNESQRKELDNWFIKLIFLNILDQLHDSLSQEERDKIIASSPAEEIKMENVEQALISLKQFGITQEKSQEMLKKAQYFAIAKIQE